MLARKVEIFSERVTSGNRTHFLDVKQLEDGSRYVSIREMTTRVGQGPIEARIIVGERELGEFCHAIARVVRFLKGETAVANELESEHPGSGLAPILRRAQHAPFQSIRQRHPRAYAPWTPEEEERVKLGFARGETIEHLAETLQRQPGAIRSRLHRLSEMDT